MNETEKVISDNPPQLEVPSLVAQKETNEPVPQVFSGSPIYNGLALGVVQLLSEGELEIPHFQIERPQVRAESNRLRAAFNTVIRELNELKDNSLLSAPAEAVAFIDMHLQILNDESLITGTQDIIGEKLVNAEWALSLKLDQIQAQFEAIDDDYLSQRVDDINQVLDRVQQILTGRRGLTDEFTQTFGDKSIVLVAKKLSPADILIFRRRYDESIGGLIIETGSATSHTAILARAMEIPTIVGVIGISDAATNGTSILLDSTRGFATLNPDLTQQDEIRSRIRELNAIQARQKKLRTVTSQTVDGVPIHLYANLALAEDVKDALRLGAEGVGLFRSEFIFMNRNDLPSEDEQCEVYSRVIRAMKGRPVTIRTIDLGGDKVLSDEILDSLNDTGKESHQNPALGRRALRFCRSQPSLFDTQLRAILRASVDANVRILLPMIAHPSEIVFARERIAAAEADLRQRNVKHAESLPLGGMIEVPAAAIMPETFLPLLDFVSLGTNDLIQYTLAVDRHDASVSYLYNPWHPSLLRLIGMTARAANAAKKELCICGEVAGDPEMIRFFIGIGIRHFSMESVRMLALKEKILSINCAEATEAINKIRRTRKIEKRIKLIEAMKN